MNWRGWTLAGVAFVIVALAGFGVVKLVRRPPTQIVTLPNGMRYRFTSATYGTNHVMESPMSALARRLPGPFEKLTRRMMGIRLGQRQTWRPVDPSLAVWFEPLGPNIGPVIGSSSVMALLVDENGVVSGERENSSFLFGPGSPRWSTEEFKAIPRRRRTLECVLFEYDYRREQSNRYRELGRVRFRNPAYGEFPEWTPELLPATKPLGDLKVTLHDFLSGVRSGGTHTHRNGRHFSSYPAAGLGEEPAAVVRFTVDSPRGTNESWAVSQFFLADATGNNLKASSWSHSVGRPAHFSPVLWPGENAWKLTARFKRGSGFPDRDLVVFHDVPLPEVGRTNQVRLTNTVNEIQCILDSIALRPPMTNRSYSSHQLSFIKLRHVELPEGFAVDLVSVTFDDPDAKVESGGSRWSGSEYESEFSRFPTNQTHATVIYAVQPTREVEFMVAPNWVDSTNSVAIEVERY